MLKKRPNGSRNPRQTRLLLAAAAAAVAAAACLPARGHESFESREPRESRDTREARESRDSRDSRESREVRETADKSKSEREPRDAGRSSTGNSSRDASDKRSGDGDSEARESGSPAGSAKTRTSDGGDGAKASDGGDAGKTTTSTTSSKSGGGSTTDAAKAKADADQEQVKRAEDADKAAADAAEEAAKEAEDAAEDAADAAEDEAKDIGHDSRIDVALDDRIRGGEPMAVERGHDGRERIAGEVLMVDRAADVARVRSAGYSLRGERALPARGETMARVQLRAGQSVEQALRQLQTLAPQGTFAANHVFRPSQEQPGRDAARVIAAPVVKLPAPGAAAAARPFSVGIIDTGADLSAAPIAAAVSRSRSFVGNTFLARGHGTLVAEIAAAGGARLALADVFGADADQRLVAPADAIAAALAWLIEERAEVINISIEGPDNPVMALMIRRALAAGIVIVAAAGNGGPAAPPAYPAAYPGVIAVTAIDGRDQVYRRANRGAYITFAAPGVNVVSSVGSFGGQPVSGTSFAAPAVAATIARDLRATGAAENRRLPVGGDAASGAGAGADAVLARLRAAARDLGPAGYDPVYGWGAVGVTLPASAPR